MPMFRSRYPDDWEAISKRIRFERAGGKCENCGAEHMQPNPATGKTVILTCAHLPTAEGTMDCRDEVLMSLCQLCHNRLDGPMRRQHAATTRALRKGQLAFAMLQAMTEAQP